MISRRTFLSLTGACATALLAGCALGDGADTPDALDPDYVARRARPRLRGRRG
ncbi:hypothetical protein [Thermophilibacter provencensis]|uniref:Twin-arginine translocation signal domain-containing protein n=1 Tax=Thermophilibacter provencensis TaxID=1852386 RepID=A0A921GIC3_9ACTN|nr:hypothetical protein [Thermophilibacter provencensis]HJF45673.1 hypothetical protein [Thermophilibacter provencensis]